MRNCGNCAGAEKTDNAETVWCFGAPPTTVACERDVSTGRITTTSSSPLLNANRRPCLLHRYRWSFRHILWTLTGGKW